MMEESLPGTLPFLAGGVTQLAFVVEDVEAVVADYYRTFGVGGWAFYTYQKPFVQGMSYRGREADYAMRVALSYFGETRVEFIQPLRGPSIYEEFVERHGYGVQHIGVLVEQIGPALERARQAGFSVIQDGWGFGPDGDGHYAYLDTASRFGTTIELIQRPARRHPPERYYPENPGPAEGDES